MEIGTTLYVKDRRQWRAWLSRHHKTAPEIWRIAHVFDHESDTKRKLEWRGPPANLGGLQQNCKTRKNSAGVPPPRQKNRRWRLDATQPRAGPISPALRALP